MSTGENKCICDPYLNVHFGVPVCNKKEMSAVLQMLLLKTIAEKLRSLVEQTAFSSEFQSMIDVSSTTNAVAKNMYLMFCAGMMSDW